MPKSLFGPSAVTKTDAAFQSPTCNVTVLDKVVTPIFQLLGQLVPEPSKPIPLRKTLENPLVVGIKQTQNRARTQNNANAYTLHPPPWTHSAASMPTRLGRKPTQQLDECWEESPKLTLRIIRTMRSIHEGHNNKIGFDQAFKWLFKIEDDIFEVVESDGEIVGEVAKMPHGYYKDLLIILALAMRGKFTGPALELLKVPLIWHKTRTIKEWKGIKVAKKKQNQEFGVD